MESNIFYQLAQAISRKGDDLETVASEMAKALAEIIREEDKPFIDEVLRLVRM